MAAPRIIVVELPALLGPEARVEWVLAELEPGGSTVVEQGAVNFGGIGSLARYKPARWVGVVPASISTVLACDLPANLIKQNKLQAALEGSLEDKLLGDISSTALSSGPVGIYTLGRITQASATKRDWLDKMLTMSKAQQLNWTSLVPEAGLLKPGEAYAKGDGSVLLCSREGDAATLPANAPMMGKDSDWTPLDMEPAQWLAQAATTPWSILQGDYGPQARSAKLSQALGDLWQRGRLKPALWALAALLGASIIGVNAKAWQLRQQVSERKAQQMVLLKRAAPRLENAPAEPAILIKRELATLRAATGQPEARDVEAMLSAVNGTVAGGERWQRIEAKPGEMSLGLTRAPDGSALEALKSRGYQATADASGLRLKVTP